MAWSHLCNGMRVFSKTELVRTENCLRQVLH